MRSERGRALAGRPRHAVRRVLAEEADVTSPVDVEVLAEQIHEHMCNDTPQCAQSEHRSYYRDKAENIIAQLEPEIGLANVLDAVRVVLDELW